MSSIPSCFYKFKSKVNLTETTKDKRFCSFLLLRSEKKYPFPELVEDKLHYFPPASKFFRAPGVRANHLTALNRRIGESYEELEN